MSTIPPPPSPVGTPRPSPPRRLVRLEDQGKIAGVAAGLGWYFGIDPVLVRIALVVLTIGTGLGIPAYIIAWIVLPDVKSADSTLAPPPPPTQGRPLALLVIGTVVALLLLGQIDLFSGEVMTAAVLIGIGVLLFTDASSLGLGARTGRARDAGQAPPWGAGPPWGGHAGPGQGGPGHGGPGQSQSQHLGPHGLPTPPPPAAPGRPDVASPEGAASWGRTSPDSPSAPTAPTAPQGPAGWHGPQGFHGPVGSHGHGGSPGFGGLHGSGSGPAPQPQSAYEPYAGAWKPASTATEDGPRRPKSFLGGLAVAVWLVTIGIAALLDRIGAVTITPLRVVALTVLVAGLALVAGTIVGRARGLIVVGVLGSLLLLPLSAVQGMDVPLSGGIGERVYTPQTITTVPERYELLIGSQTIDLTDLELDGQTVPVTARMMAGELIIRVPDDAQVSVRGTLQAGEYTILDEVQAGTSHAFNVEQEGDPDVGRIELDLSVLAGEIVVESVERR